MRKSSPALARLEHARALGIETCGRIAQFWGFTRTMGRAFGLLYLAPEPVTQAEVQRRLGVSTGSASMTLGALSRWGVVHKISVPGSRRDHYTAETDFWKMISGVLNERERREIRTAIETMQAAQADTRAARRALGRHDRAAADHTARRLGSLSAICELGEVMLDMLLGKLTLDVSRFRDVLKV